MAHTYEEEPGKLWRECECEVRWCAARALIGALLLCLPLAAQTVSSGRGVASGVMSGTGYDEDWPTLPQVWVDNNELTCKLPGNSCATGSPGNSLVAPAYDLTLGASGGTWASGAPSGCTFTLANYTNTGAGLQAAVGDVQACRTAKGNANPTGFIIHYPPGLYSTSGGILIPQTANTQALAPIILRADAASRIALDALPALVCAGGVQDNLPTSVHIGLNNPDCTGKNMYYQLAPKNGGGDWSTGTPGVITGITTLSANTYSLNAITASGSPQLLYLANGYVAPGNSYIVGTGANQETVVGVIGVNQVGLYGVFTKAHAAGTPVTFCTSGCSYTLANGQNINTANYNYLQYMAQVQCTGTACVPLQFCSPVDPSSSGTQCVGPIGPDHWQIEDAAFSLCPGSNPDGTPTNCVGASNNQFLIITGNTIQETDPALSHFSQHIHLRRIWAHGDMTSLGVGENAVADGVHIHGCLYCSLGDSQVSEALRPGGEGHAVIIGAQSLKLYNLFTEGESSNIFCGGFGQEPGVASFIPCKNVEYRIGLQTFPYPWLGFQCAYSSIDGTTNNGNACGNVADYNPYWGGAGGNYPFLEVATTGASFSSPNVTLSVASNPGFVVGNNIAVTGLKPTGCNGTFHITAIGSGTLTYSNAGCATITDGVGVATLAPTCGTGATANTTCVTVNGTTVTWVSGPPFHDANSAWTVGTKKITLYYDNQSPTSANIAGSWTPSGTCSLGDFFDYTTGGGCPKTLDLKDAQATASTPIPFVSNSAGIVRKNPDELKEAQYLLKSGITFEGNDNSGAQFGIISASGVRGTSGGYYSGAFGSNYNATIEHVTVENTIGRHTCTGRGMGARSGGPGDGGGVSFQLNYEALLNNIDYDVTPKNPGCGSSDNGLHFTSGNQEWNGTVSCTAGSPGSCTFVATACEDAGVDLTGDVSGSASTWTYTTAVSDNKTNAAICGCGTTGQTCSSQSITPNNVLVLGFTAQPGNNSADANGMACVSSTATTLVLTNPSGVADTAAAEAGAYSLKANPVINSGPTPPNYGAAGYFVLGERTGDMAYVKNQNPNTNNCAAAMPHRPQGSSHDVSDSAGSLITQGTQTWDDAWSVGKFLTVTYQWNGATVSDSSGNCIFDNILGGPDHVTVDHYTLISDTTAPVGDGQGVANGSNWARGYRFTNSILLSRDGATNAGWYNSSLGTSAEGNQTIAFENDLGTLTADRLVFPGRAAKASSYTDVTNPFFPTQCGVGFLASCSTTVPLNLADWHQYGLSSGSSYHNAASDGTDIGAIISSIDAAQTLNTYVCHASCGSPGPFPNK